MASCMVCEDEVTKKNPLFVCVGCDTKVHKLCYGIHEPQKNWKCSPCCLGKTSFVKCQLCFQKGNGPMKQTECDKWVHVVCALFTEGVTFPDDQTMEPVNLSNVCASARNKLCAFCYNSKGYCSTCSNAKCKTTFHITCAQKQRLLREEKIDPQGNAVMFNAYCKDHLPNGSHSRLSSGSVQNVVDKKRQKVLKTKGASADADWILNGVQSHSTPISKRKHRKLRIVILSDKCKCTSNYFNLFKPTLKMYRQLPRRQSMKRMMSTREIQWKRIHFLLRIIIIRLKRNRMRVTKTKSFKRLVWTFFFHLSLYTILSI